MWHILLNRRNNVAEENKTWIDRSLDHVQNKAADIVFNKAKPVLERAVADAIPRAKEAASFYAGETLSRVGAAGMDSHDPRHVARAIANPELTRRYFSQRQEQFLRVFELAMRPRDAAMRSLIGTREAIYRSVDYYKRLDSGRKTIHARDAMLDMGVDSAAEVVFSMAVLNTVKLLSRRRTQAAMEHYFPLTHFYGRKMRRLVPRMMFTKRISRMLAIPGFYASYAAFRLGTHIGRNIKSLEDLKSSNSAFAHSLEQENRDMLAPSAHNNFINSINKTSVKNPMSTRALALHECEALALSIVPVSRAVLPEICKVIYPTNAIESVGPAPRD